MAIEPDSLTQDHQKKGNLQSPLRKPAPKALNSAASFTSSSSSSGPEAENDINLPREETFRMPPPFPILPDLSTTSQRSSTPIPAATPVQVSAPAPVPAPAPASAPAPTPEEEMDEEEEEMDVPRIGGRRKSSQSIGGTSPTKSKRGKGKQPSADAHETPLAATWKSAQKEIELEFKQVKMSLADCRESLDERMRALEALHESMEDHIATLEILGPTAPTATDLSSSTAIINGLRSQVDSTITSITSIYQSLAAHHQHIQTLNDATASAHAAHHALAAQVGADVQRLEALINGLQNTQNSLISQVSDAEERERKRPRTDFSTAAPSHHTSFPHTLTPSPTPSLPQQCSVPMDFTPSPYSFTPAALPAPQPTVQTAAPYGQPSYSYPAAPATSLIPALAPTPYPAPASSFGPTPVPAPTPVNPVEPSFVSLRPIAYNDVPKGQWDGLARAFCDKLTGGSGKIAHLKRGVKGKGERDGSLTFTLTWLKASDAQDFFKLWIAKPPIGYENVTIVRGF